MIMDDKIKAAGFVIVDDPRNGAIIYRCPNGHLVNYFLEPYPYDYRCPMCSGHSSAIARRLSELNSKSESEVEMIKVKFSVEDKKTKELLWFGQFLRPVNKNGKYRYVELDNPTGEPTREIIITINEEPNH